MSLVGGRREAGSKGLTLRVGRKGLLDKKLRLRSGVCEFSRKNNQIQRILPRTAARNTLILWLVLSRAGWLDLLFQLFEPVEHDVDLSGGRRLLFLDDDEAACVRSDGVVGRGQGGVAHFKLE